MSGHSNQILAAIVICANAPIDGFSVEAVVWKADMDPANSFILTGTIQDVKQRLIRVNPSWTLSDNDKQTKKTMETDKTADFPGLSCNALPSARTSAVEQAVHDLEHAHQVQLAFPTNRGNYCVTVSCVDDARVWWCSSSPITLHLPDSWKFFALKTRVVMESCAAGDASFVSGQYSPPGAHFTVVVRGERCDSVPERLSWRIPSMATC
ncbi:hypothetical protein L249_6914 [Ophiocordyceps polyrhachis-furcata BCC 54312]|uniref:Uncharacterized protein n=1 Tax=Ophiocordyceps polyrhachis-furcata BCC 54312 TaxID=1330021 RepID=A0A367LK61_9HYPO|nr:hypothetical protein L249_6914 [Ophiocordyceps polyrhachis-furcata BCC 54312]